MADEAEVQEKVIEVTAQVLDLDPSEISIDSRFAEDLGAESVQGIELAASFAAEFGYELGPDEEDEALACKTVGAAAAFIKTQLG